LSDFPASWKSSMLASLYGLKKFFLVDELPTSPNFVAPLLDACIEKDDFKRNQGDDWYSAVGNRKLCRIPGFQRKFDAFVERNTQNWAAPIVDGLLLTECQSIHNALPWKNGDFGKNQISAIKGDRPVIFERAAITSLALNGLIVSDINRCLEEVALIDGKIKAAFSDGLPEEMDKELLDLIKDRIILIRKATDLSGLFVFEHQISISCFYFYDIWPIIEFATSKNEKGSITSLIEYVADETGQTKALIEGLLGNKAPKTSQQKDLDRVAKNCASYPTIRSVWKTILSIESCRDEVGPDEDRARYIQRLHTNMGHRKALDEESILPPQRITRPPYNWGNNEGDEESPHPP